MLREEGNEGEPRMAPVRDQRRRARMLSRT